MYINQSHLFACAASALNVVNIGGVFVVLLCGLSVAILVAIMEFCWRARKINNESHPMLGQVSADHCMVRQHSAFSNEGHCRSTKASAGQSKAVAINASQLVEIRGRLFKSAQVRKIYCSFSAGIP